MKERNHACDICGQRFGAKEHMTRHRESVHFGKKCDICGQRFGHKGHMTRHKRGFSPSYAPTFGVVSKNHSSWRTFHTVDTCSWKDFAAPCLWPAVLPSSAAPHLWRWNPYHFLLGFHSHYRCCLSRLPQPWLVHMKVRNHACDICGKRFGHKGHITRHRECVHSGKKRGSICHYVHQSQVNKLRVKNRQGRKKIKMDKCQTQDRGRLRRHLRHWPLHFFIVEVHQMRMRVTF